ncbi:SDR family NAD(P)-dependent oxidoreductase [Streptomyces sp. 900116325]
MPVTTGDRLPRRPNESEQRAGVGRFGLIDVLVNNAGNFFAGNFEEFTPDQMRRQIEINLFGPWTSPAPSCPSCASNGTGTSSPSPRPPA